MITTTRLHRRAASVLAACVLATTTLLAITVATTSPAWAGGTETSTMNINWSKVLDVLHRSEVAFFASRMPGHMERTALREETEEAFEQTKWFGTSPHLSLIARDWGGPQAVYGDLLLMDQLRLTRSSRMVVTRVRLARGRFVPFVHLGIGQWRVDPDLMPVWPRDVEIATQLGLGFETRLSRRFTLAIEVDNTHLYRDEREPQQFANPNLWGTFLAMRAGF